MMKRTLSLGSLTAALWLQAASAHADPLHHRGFMLRAGLGAGYANTSQTNGTTTISVSGVSGCAQLAIGGYVASNFALHGTIWGGSVISPSVTVRSSSGGSLSGVATNASLTATAFGVGVTYFLSPADVYFTGSLGAGILQQENTRGSIVYRSQTSAGLALHLGVGKQWAVSPDFGLGVSGQFGWQSNPDNDGASSPALSTVQLGVLFSLTYH